MIVSPGGTAGWRVKIGDFGISRPLESAVASALDDDFRAGVAALEMLGVGGGGFAADDDRGHVVREQRADVYRAGELAFCLLTREAPFPDAAGLANYVLQPDIFPSWILRARGASDAAVDFVRVAMRPAAEARPTARQGLEHAWAKPRASSVHFLAE
jgi:serine/threonine protein kinase